jgi:hypothetical protein
MKTLNLTSTTGEETTVAIVRETAKAILVKGNCSEAWLPKAAISEAGEIAPWLDFSLSHTFLFIAPFGPAAAQ